MMEFHWLKFDRFESHHCLEIGFLLVLENSELECDQ